MVTATLSFILAFQRQSIVTYYVPSKVSVLVVPAVNLSGDKYEAMKVRQSREADETLTRLFSSRGFHVLHTTAATSVQLGQSPNVDDSQVPDALCKMGSLARAKLVVFTEITQTRQHDVHILVAPSLAGYATVRTWLYDVPNHWAFLSASTEECRSTALLESGSERQTRAVRLGLESQLRQFLFPYPEINGQK